jgi:hypothetical protein
MINLPRAKSYIKPRNILLYRASLLNSDSLPCLRSLSHILAEAIERLAPMTDKADYVFTRDFLDNNRSVALHSPWQAC